MKLAKIVFIVFALIYLCLFFLTTKVMPLVADDYGYRWTAISGNNLIFDGLRVAKEYYLIWGGRSIAHFFAHLIMWSYSETYGFLIFAIANTIIFTIILYSSYVIIKPSPQVDSKILNKEPEGWNFFSLKSMLTISLLILFLTINPKSHYQTLFWATGVAHYSWMYFIFIVALARFKSFFLEEGELKLTFLNILILFCVGLSYENVGLSLCALVGLRLVWNFWISRNENKKIFPKWNQIAPLVVIFIGSMIMLLAPGNKLRENVAFPEGTGTIFNKIQWWIESWFVFFGRPEGFLVLLISGIVLFKLKKYRHHHSILKIIKENQIVRNLGLLCILMAACYLGHSGNFYGRKGFNVGWIFCLFLLSLIIRSGYAEAISSMKLKRASLFMVLILTLASSRWVYDYFLLKDYSNKIQTRERAILNLKSVGQLDVKTYSIMNPFGLEDLSEETEHWINTPYAKILGVNSISVSPLKE